MQTKITRIGNSKGIIIPAKILKHCGFNNEVSIEIKDQSIIISNIRKPREGWKEAFIEAGLEKEELLLDGIDNHFDKGEWTW